MAELLVEHMGKALYFKEMSSFIFQKMYEVVFSKFHFFCLPTRFKESLKFGLGKWFLVYK
jgi:hypothetical protein